MSLAPGTKIGGYEIVDLLGSGGMGEVYRARDPRIGRDVAIKVLPASFNADRSRIARFEQEARAAGVLNHPNLLTVYELGSHHGAPFIVSELLEGQTLRSRLSAGPLPRREAIDYAIEIANDTRFGLAAAVWTQNIHRGHRVAHRLRAGTVWINAYRVVSFATPFGGFKESGLGRENGMDSIRDYTETKSVYVELSGEPRDPFRLG